MGTTDKVINISKATTVAEEMRNKIVAVAENATSLDKAMVADIVAAAKEGGRAVKIYRLTPPVCAILFLEHNSHNRDWRAQGAKSCQEYGRRMKEGQWQFNNSTIGLYRDGKLEDGQHRLSAAAAAEFHFDATLVFGIEYSAITTVDDGLARHASDAAALDGIGNARRKEKIVRDAAFYNTKVAGRASAALRSATEISQAIKQKNGLLDEAIAIGEDSVRNISADPALKLADAQTLALLCLEDGWPPSRIREALIEIQEGVSKGGEKTPLFVGAEFLRKHGRSKDVKDRLTTIKAIGVAIYVMAQVEQGVTALLPNNLKNAVKKELPSPAYPVEPVQAAAE